MINYCGLNNLELETGPKELLGLHPKVKANFDLLVDTITKLETKGKPNGEKYAGSYLGSIKKAVISWLGFNEIEFKQQIKIRGEKESNLKSKIPEPKEVEEVIAAAQKLKVKVICSIMAYCDPVLRFLETTRELTDYGLTIFLTSYWNRTPSSKHTRQGLSFGRLFRNRVISTSAS